MRSEESLLNHLIEFRRDLHRNPELSWQESRTSQKISEALEALGISWRRVAGTGILAELPGRIPAPYIALRGDIDALPIQEESEVGYASNNQGVMHACGHDGHTTILLGAARLLRGCELELPVRLVFQPAEETGAGALAMIEAGALQDVAAIFGGHLDHLQPAGTIVAVEGAVNASTDGLHFCIHTSGGHAARPHEGRDAVVVGAYLVTALQTLISRELNPGDPAVLTIGRFQAGTAGNVLADQAELRGTLRTLRGEVRKQLHGAIQRVAKATAQLFEARIELEIQDGTPPLVNRGKALEVAQAAARRVVGPDNLRPLATLNMGGEDFAHYLEQVPGCFVRWGARLEPARPAHTSRFDFDEKALLVGARYLKEVAMVAGRAFGPAQP